VPTDDASGDDLDNPVCHGNHELVVMGGEKNHLLEFDQGNPRGVKGALAAGGS
jgi:hypothetical protein